MMRTARVGYILLLAVVANFAGVISGAHAQAPQAGVVPVAAQAAAADAKLAYDSASKLTGYKRADGTWLIEPRYKSASEFLGGLAFVEPPDGSGGLIDEKGTMIVPNVQQALWVSEPAMTEARFSEGLAAVGLNDNWPRTNLDPPGKLGYIDRQGRWVIAPIYAAGKPFVDGKAVVMAGEKQVVLERPAKR